MLRPKSTISIVTPSFNQAEFIEETIQSVLHQEYPGVEYIIIDGGSEDGSENIIRKYEDQLTFWVSEPDAGQTDAINKGLRHATGDIVAYINSDDSYCPGTFLKIAEYFEQNHDVAMVYGDVLRTDRNGEYLTTFRPSKLNFTKWLGDRFHIPQPAVFFRHCILDEIGYFDPRYQLGMDKEYWTRIMLNYRVGYLPEILAKMRIYKEAKSYYNCGYLDENLTILDSVFADPKLPGRQQDLFSDSDTLKREAYSSVYFTGGLRYLKRRKFSPAIRNTLKGIRMNPWHIFSPSLYWSFFIAVIGLDRSVIILHALQRQWGRRGQKTFQIQDE